MSSWRTLWIACAAFLLLSPAPVAGQAKDRFVAGVVDFINAADEPSDRARLAAVAAMADGLSQWDALIRGVEAGLAAEIGGVSPQTAARMRMALGAVYLERGRFAEALTQFDAAAALDAASPDVHVFRGLALQNTARSPEAAEAYRRAWQSDRSNAVNAYRFLRATRAAVGSQDAIGALEALQAAVTTAGAAGAAPFALINFDLLDDAMSSVPVIPLASYAEAFAQLRRGRYDEALTRFRAAVADERTTGAARGPGERDRLAAADAHVAAGDLAAARQTLREAVQAFPLSHRSWWKLGILLQTAGDQQGAADAFAAAAPGAIAGGAALFATTGRLHHARLDLDAAVAAYEQRTALQPNDGAGHLDLAEVYRARDDLDAALVEGLAAALLDPANAKALALIGQLHAAAGRDADALPLLRRAVALAPSDAESRYALGRALLRLGRIEEGERELEVFQRLLAKAMDDERRRFRDNMLKIDDALKTAAPQAPLR